MRKSDFRTRWSSCVVSANAESELIPSTETYNVVSKSLHHFSAASRSRGSGSRSVTKFWAKLVAIGFKHAEFRPRSAYLLRRTNKIAIRWAWRCRSLRLNA